MPKRYLTVFCAVCAFANVPVAQTAYAACATPAGVEGEMVYNADHKVLQYCDGIKWVGVGWKGAPPSAPAQPLPACDEGDVLRRGTSGWECYTLPPDMVIP